MAYYNNPPPPGGAGYHNEADERGHQPYDEPPYGQQQQFPGHQPQVPFLGQQYQHQATYSSDYNDSNVALPGGFTDPHAIGAAGTPDHDPSNPGGFYEAAHQQQQQHPHWQQSQTPPNDGFIQPPGGGAALYPAYTNDSANDSRWANVNPFDTPMDRHAAGPAQSTEDIPLMNQNGGRVGGYLPMMSGDAGGFVNPVTQADHEDEDSQVRYGRIPQRIPRRLKTVKQVTLFRGNLVLDVPVPKKLLESCPFREDREFSRMRYTACTSDPDDFVREKYALRQVLMDPPRQTELMIAMTMYNEGEDLFARTMYGVQKNVQHLCTRTRSKMWGKDAWKKVVVVVVSDGRQKVNSRTLSALACQGVYQDGVAKNVVNGKPVECHIYEYTTQIALTPDLKYKGAESGIVPVQIIFALKERNQKKINSHRWFFNAFAKCLNPNVCVLLDVGTQPGPTSIYHLWKSFDTNSNVGGACGEIVTMPGKYWTSLLNPLVAAQNFEYKMSNILDKPLESVFGYITVLPGAFSAYRWHALQNDSAGNGPLAEYFKGETLENKVDADLLTKNMYLAEDRVLCWELVSKRQSAWTLHYTKSAYGVTDTPTTVPELISQRRRWLNGSFFAAIHATVKFGYVYRSDHSFLRKFWLHIELVYQIFQQLFAWFALANYYIAFSILTNALNYKWARIVSAVLHYVYLACLVMCFLLAMGNTPAGGRKSYMLAIIIFAIITAYMTFCAIFLVVKSIQSKVGMTFGELIRDENFRNIVLSMMATYGLWLYASIIFFEPWHMFTSFIQYILLSPTWINIINVYAFCNVHDVSWGTKGQTSVSHDLGVVKASGAEKDKVDVDVPSDEKDIDAAYEDARHVLAQKAPKEVKKAPDPVEKAKDSYANIRTNVVLVWALTNAALVAGIVGSGAANDIQTQITGDSGQILTGTAEKVGNYMAFLLFSVAGLAFIKAIGSTIYITTWLFQG